VRVENLLRERRHELDRLARALIENETLTREEIEMVLKGDDPKRPSLNEELEKTQKAVAAANVLGQRPPLHLATAQQQDQHEKDNVNGEDEQETRSSNANPSSHQQPVAVSR
jgi:hypothetical protein